MTEYNPILVQHGYCIQVTYEAGWRFGEEVWYRVIVCIQGLDISAIPFSSTSLSEYMTLGGLSHSMVYKATEQ